MKKNFFTLLFCLMVVSTQLWAVAPILKKITSGGIEREYLVYTPSNYDASNAGDVGLLVCLHGLNCSMDDFFDDYHIELVADALNFVVIAPNALPEQDNKVKTNVNSLTSATGMPLDLSAVWGAGLLVDVVVAPEDEWAFGVFGLSDFELNKDVDDVAFIKTIINNTQVDYTKINSQHIFMLGTSMGSYMTYRYAMTYGDGLAGLISVAGTMGLAIPEKTFTKPLPVCDFHCETDETVPYTGNFLYTIGSYPVTIKFGKPKSEVISQWVTWNGATTTPEVINYDIPGKPSAIKYAYSATAGGAEVIHYKLSRADHSHYFATTKGDAIDFNEEILNFVTRNKITSGTPHLQQDKIAFYPNPARDFIRFNLSEGAINIYELSGGKVFSGQLTGQDIDVSYLVKGMYIVQIEAGNTMLTHKLIKE